MTNATRLIMVALMPVVSAFGAEPTPKAGPSAPMLQAGAATSNITPWLGDGLVGGWTAPPAKHIHDELHARCLVLDDGPTRLAIVLVDNVSIPREVCDEAKRQIQEPTGSIHPSWASCPTARAAT